jgi:hypothetical protein
MVLLAKAALGLGGTLVLAGAYAFRDGLIRVDVDEYRAGGSHVHMWVPAARVPMAMHFVPKHDLCDAAQHAREVLPAIHAFAKELKKLPNVDLIEMIDGGKHAQFRTRSGNLQVDVDSADEHVHLRVPLSTLDDVVGQLEESAPGV